MRRMVATRDSNSIGLASNSSQPVAMAFWRSLATAYADMPMIGMWPRSICSTPVILSGCTQEEAAASLRGDLQVDEFEIIHARFPCRSPDMHFFGYRFRIGLKGEYAYGDICWNASAREWTWQILPRYPPYRVSIFTNSVPCELKNSRGRDAGDLNA